MPLEKQLNQTFRFVFIIQNSNVRMQFKRNFSANLQNLPVRKTFVVQPPASNNTSFSSSRNTHQSTDDLFCNKENMKSHRHLPDAAKQNVGSKADQSKMSPFLTFEKVKKNNQAMQEAVNRKTCLVADNSRNNLSRNAQISEQSLNCSSNMKGSNSHSNMLQSGHSNGVRLGSMVFSGSIAKRQASQSIYNPSESKESKSIEKTCRLKAERKEIELECMNKDSRAAKYKVIKMDQDDQILHYCFNCVIPLINQGFTVQELTQDDLIQLNSHHSQNTSNSFHKHKGSVSRQPLPNTRVKTGEQVKSKIIMKLNRLKAEREEFSKAVQNQLESIDFFYNSLATYIEQRRMTDRQEVMRMRSLRKAEPQNYESQLGSALGTVDYMIKNLYGINHDYLSQVERIIKYNVSYPKLPQATQGYQAKIDEFVSYFERSLKINFEEESSIQSRRFVQTEQSYSRNHPMRYSFEEALDQSRKNRSFAQRNEFSEMNPLQEENQSELEDSMLERRQNAFRNLFPSESESLSSSEKGGKLSPVFKQF